MVRSLWSAASGMIAQQTNVDTIANNLANVNTTGYKTEIAEFKSLLYQTMQTNVLFLYVLIRKMVRNRKEDPYNLEINGKKNGQNLLHMENYMLVLLT